MKVKWLLLFVLIGMPVCVYLFLQTFGKNQFDIPVYYETGLTSSISGCEMDLDQKPYRADLLFDDSLSSNLEKDKVVVYDLGYVHNGETSAKNNLLTFLNKFKGQQDLVFISLSTQNEKTGLLQNFDQYQGYKCSAEEALNFGRCVLRTESMYDNTRHVFQNNQLVLCDKERRIRGYYDASELKEIDRLNTELHILLKN